MLDIGGKTRQDVKNAPTKRHYCTLLYQYWNILAPVATLVRFPMPRSGNGFTSDRRASSDSYRISFQPP